MRQHPGHLAKVAKDCWRNNIRQVPSDQALSSSGGASATTQTVGQQHANVSQQGNSAKNKPVLRRIANSEPIIFDLRQGDDELEDQGIRITHFYIGDDDEEPEFQEVEEIDISDDEPMVRRRLGEGNEDVAIIVDSGADVALFPFSMADHGEGEIQFSTKTKIQHAQGNRIPTGGAKSVEMSSRDLDGREVLLKENAIFSSRESTHVGL